MDLGGGFTLGRHYEAINVWKWHSFVFIVVLTMLACFLSFPLKHCPPSVSILFCFLAILVYSCVTFSMPLNPHLSFIKMLMASFFLKKKYLRNGCINRIMIIFIGNIAFFTRVYMYKITPNTTCKTFSSLFYHPSIIDLSVINKSTTQL